MDNDPNIPLNQTPKIIANPSSSKTLVIVLSLFFVLIIIILVGWFIYSKKLLGSPVTPKKTQPVQNLISQPANNKPPTVNNPPLQPKAGFIDEIGIIYKINTELVAVKDLPNKEKLIIVKDEQLPRIVYTNVAQIFQKYNNQERTAVTIDALKPQQKLEIITLYSFKSKSWMLQQILILNEATPSASPTNK